MSWMCLSVNWLHFTLATPQLARSLLRHKSVKRRLSCDIVRRKLSAYVMFHSYTPTDFGVDLVFYGSQNPKEGSYCSPEILKTCLAAV